MNISSIWLESVIRNAGRLEDPHWQPVTGNQLSMFSSCLRFLSLDRLVSVEAPGAD